MTFTLTETQHAWQRKGDSLGREIAAGVSADAVVAAAARAGLLDPSTDLLSVAVAVTALACERPAAAVAFALHSAVIRGLDAALLRRDAPSGEPDLPALIQGRIVGSMVLSSEDRPIERHGLLRGRASWAAPLTRSGVVLVGASRAGTGGDGVAVCAASLADPRVSTTQVSTAGLPGVVCGHVEFHDAPGIPAGQPEALMASARVLLAAAGLGMGRRALRESLQASRRYAKTGPGGEQTLHGLLADTATDLDAAMLLIWKAASAPRLSLAAASMAKLAATEATQRAVLRATQVVGADSFAQGHALDRLSQDVRALELFAGRTEALREAVAAETLPGI